MLVVETIAKIRRAYFVQGKPIKQICRELKLSRKVVRKVLRSEETAFEYKRNVQPQPKLGAWRDELDRLLASNAARSSRERVTLLRIYEDLRGLGYEGGYDAVRRYAAAWRRRASTGAAAAFVPLSFDPGEAYQFDWSHEIVLGRRDPGPPVTIMTPEALRLTCAPIADCTRYDSLRRAI
jgi:hypothetical protein